MCNRLEVEVEFVEGFSAVGDPIFNSFFQLGKGFAVFMFDKEPVVSEPFSAFLFGNDGSFADPAGAFF
jgi:hypothetical protein